MGVGGTEGLGLGGDGEEAVGRWKFSFSPSGCFQGCPVPSGLGARGIGKSESSTART